MQGCLTTMRAVTRVPEACTSAGASVLLTVLFFTVSSSAVLLMDSLLIDDTEWWDVESSFGKIYGGPSTATE